MDRFVIVRFFIIGSVLLATATSSLALTLGRTRGVVWVGQPVEVTVPVRLEAGEALADLCFTADVFYADSQVLPDRVQILTEPGSSPQEATLRIRSTAIIDEPYVTIYLKSGCAQKLTRRYVLLTEVATSLPDVGAGTLGLKSAPTQTATTKPSGATAAGPGPRPGPQASGAGGVSAGATDTGAGTGTVAAAPRGASTPTATKVRPPSVVRKKAVAEIAKPRLRLDPLDFAAERDPTLKATTELLTTPLEDDPKRAAAAALWRAINAQPADVLRDAQRLQDLEKDLKSLRDQTLRTQSGISELRTQLQQAEDQRYANSLVYALMGLLVLALAAAAYFWNRLRQGAGAAAWWQEGADRPVTAKGPLTKTQTTISSPLPELRPGVAGLDVDLDLEESRFDTMHKTVPDTRPARPGDFARLDTADFASSFGGSSRAVNTEELFDIQQQADFFVSLGQFEQAITVLRNHILENPDTSALAYLDLFDIYHKLGNGEEYELLREDFNRVFNAQVPTFDQYHLESKGLESYTVAMSRIEALWPSSKVLGVIEESIFRKPGAGDGEAFDPEAYRELLLLHAIAKGVIEPGIDAPDSQSSGRDANPPSVELDFRAPKFSETKVQPLSTADKVLAYRDLDRAVPRPSPRLGLDIDLSDSDADVVHSAPVDLDLSLDAPPSTGGNLIDFDFDEGAAASRETPRADKP